MSSDKQELLDTYARSLPDGGGRNQLIRTAEDFLNHSDGLTRDSVEGYLNRLRKKKRAPSTINFAYRVIRRLFVVNGLEWPFRRGEAPSVSQLDEDKPALDPEVVRRMIGAARAGELLPDQACFLALSTIYGLRREEMAALGPADVQLSDRVLAVRTVKKGRERYHLIPQEILPYLEAHNWRQAYGVSTLSEMFWQIVNRCGMQELHPYRLGWHSPRRTLTTLLHEAGLDPFSVHAFMRWKGGVTGALAIDSRYHATTFVGLGTRRSTTPESTADQAIFDAHPFLPDWR